MVTRLRKISFGAMGCILSLVVTTGAFAAIVDPLYTKPVMDPLLQPKFVNPLPNPLVPGFIVSPNPAKPTGFAGDFYTVSVRQFRQSVGLVDEVTKAPLTTMVWGYGDARETNNPATGFPNGGGGITSGFHTYPGPTFEVKSTLPLPAGQMPLVAGKYPGLPVRVQWTNELLDVNGLPLQNHLLPVDTTLNCGVNAPSCFPYNRIVTHVHGAHVADDSDGHPDAWISANFETTGMNFRPNTKYGPIGTYNYQNDQESGTIWYHDHAMGITRLNVMAGLAGFFLIRDDNEERLQNSPVTATQKGVLPKFPFEVPIAIQDRTFFPDGSIAVPDQPLTNPVIQPLMVPPITVAGPTVFDSINVKPVPSIVPEFFGNMILVNGQTWPVLNVEPRKYRFRILNGSDSRTYILRFQTTTGLTDRGRFWVVGTEQGLLNVPSRQSQLVIMPGERMDVIINFAGAAAGAQFVLGNYGPDGPYSNIAPTAASIPPIANPATTGQVMAFKIVALNSTPLPAGEVGPRLDTVALTTTTPLRGAMPAYSSPVIAPLAATAGAPIRKLSLMEAFDEYGRLKLTIEGKAFMDKPSEIPKLNAVETWEIVNPTPDSHPMHLHLVKFQIVNRQPFDMLTFVPPTPYAPATYTLLGAAVLPPSFENGWKDTVRANPGEVTRIRAKFDIPGLYVWHCHILSHEEHEMMRPLVVVTPATGANLMPSADATTFITNNVTPINFEASAVPDTDGFEYRFWVKDPVAGWQVKQPYSTKRMWTWTPPANAGLYAVLVDVRQIGSSATREAFKQLNYTISAAPPVASVSLVPNLPSPQKVGTTVTFMAGAAGGSGSYEYQFWLKKGGVWSVVQDYSTSSSWTWNTTVQPTGQYVVAVYVRNAGATNVMDKSLGIAYSLN